MLKSIHIQNFKGFRDTLIKPLRKVNLVVGGQNVGKTSLLEAIYMTFAAPVNSNIPFRESQDRDSERYFKSISNADLNIDVLFDDESWSSLHNQNIKKNSGEQRSTPHHFVVNKIASSFDGSKSWNIPAVTSSFLPSQKELLNLFGKVVENLKKRELLKLLEKIETRLIDLHNISPDGENRIYVEINGVAKAIPLPQLGHGFSRLLYVFSTMLSTDSELALIDEIENGIHYSALPTLMQGIKVVAKARNVQTIMTTHSWECIRAAAKTFADTPDDFQVIRLERTPDNNVQAVMIYGEDLEIAIDAGWEIR